MALIAICKGIVPVITQLQKLQSSLGLAPMDGITDYPTRLWFSLTSTPDIVSSPFLRITHSYPHAQTPIEEIWPEYGYAMSKTTYRFVPQVMASSLDELLRSADLLLPKIPWLELNCGCPSPKVVGHRAGSSLLQDPEIFGTWLNTAGNRLGSEAFRVKMRVGYNDADEFTALMAAIKDAPLAALTVHGRTRKQHYSGQANWDLIDRAAKLMPGRVVGSGDICGFKDLQRIAANSSQVAEVVVGRGAMRNPWIFTELRSGNNVSVSRETLLAAVECYALLQMLSLDRRVETLRVFVDSGLFSQPCGSDEKLWHHALEELRRAAANGIEISNIPDASRKLIGRTKMLWAYMRTSIGISAMRPEILRAANFADFFDGIAKVFANDQTIELKHNVEFDYLFAGAPRD